MGAGKPDDRDAIAGAVLMRRFARWERTGQHQQLDGDQTRRWHTVRALLFPIGLLIGWLSIAQASAQAPDGNGTDAKRAYAARVPNDSIRLDGQLDEAVWEAAAPITDFVQKEPVEGAAPTEPMVVRFVYDETAIYVGARMYSSRPGTIQAPMSRRDDEVEAEYILVSLDTFWDRRTAYSFGVTASGVRLDKYHASDVEDGDNNFDPVWVARTRIDEEGWTAEFWVPFSQLRFNNRSDMIWGLNIRRRTPTLNEDDYWVMIPRTERGWASRFGELQGLEGIRSPRRLELLPYIAGFSRVTGQRDPANPFDDGRNLDRRVGLDAKVALGSNLTLDATVNPDFGQVEADPAEVNLSTIETIFSEKRPFFQEGSELLRGPVTNFYYSRRIGARPTGPADGDYVDYPATSTLLGAAKITGRLGSSTSIGALVAVTAAEHARSFDRETGAFNDTLVAPRTFYAVNRVEQQFGSNQSTVGFQFTALERDLKPEDPLSARLVRRALTGAVDTLLRFGNNAYEARGLASFSYLAGEPSAIERVQRSSTHFFQRPDRPGGMRLDPTRRTLAGSKLQASLEKVAGEHWLWRTSMDNDTPELETNDFGRLNSAGDIGLTNRLTYRETRPGRYLHSYQIDTSFTPRLYWDRGVGMQRNFSQLASATWRNFWYTSVGWNLNLRAQDPSMTRGGPLMELPRRWGVNGTARNSNTSRTRWSTSWSVDGSEDGDSARELEFEISIRPAPSWQFSMSPTYRRELSTRQYLAQKDGGRPEVYGKRYMFGEIRQSTVSVQLRLNYTFKPDLNLDFYAEPFAASGSYDRFGELLAPKSRELLVYGENGTTLERLADGSLMVTDGAASFTLENPDFQVKSYRSNLVLRWEWRPGSTLYLVWQQNRFESQAIRERAGLGTMFRSFSAPSDNFFAVKTTFWFSTN